MGSQVIAKCGCGYEATCLIGCGIKNYNTTCYFPFSCSSCHNVVEVNILAKIIYCPQCQSSELIPYDDPQLFDCLGKHKVAQWNIKDILGRDLVITDGKYQCPQCGEMLLKFMDGGFHWD